MDGWVKVGMVFGANRLRGAAQGAMFASEEEGGEDGASVVRKLLRDEAEELGLEINEQWLNAQMIQLLKMYEGKFVKWRKDQEGTDGFVYEMVLPSGQKVLLGEPSVLQRVNMLH